MKARVALLVILLAGGARTARAQVISSGDYAEDLPRLYFDVQPNETLTIRTVGCSTPEDTVLYLLDNPNGISTTTRAYNDDFSGLGFCSQVSWKNTSTSWKSVWLVIAAFDSYSTAIVDVQYSSSLGGGWQTYDTNVGVTAPRKPATWSSGNQLLTKPIRNEEWDGDTILFAINTAIGGKSFFDDDSGIGFHAAFTTNASCTSTSTCVIIGGAYSPSTDFNVTIWKRAGTDSDSDKVPNSIETFYGTNPNSADGDNDGLTDYEELIGIGAPDLSSGDSQPSLILPYKDADPVVQDLYWEVDYMEDSSPGGHSHRPYDALADDLRGIFQDDAGWTGRTIRTHVEIGQSIGHTPGLGYDSCPGQTWFYAVKGNPSFFDPPKLTAYHYVLVGHNQLTDACTISMSSGVAELDGNDVIVTLGADNGTVEMQRGTHVHESGHNLGLGHNGNNLSNSYSCVHSSVMNYRYQFGGWGNGTIPVLRRFSYSRGNCEASGTSCGNTCVNRCVPTSQTSPKFGCNPNTTNCDCDVAEWAVAGLNFPDGGDGAPLPGASADGSREWLRPYLLGDRAGLRAEHWQYVARKRARLLARGLREGIDFVVNPSNGKFLAVD